MESLASKIISQDKLKKLVAYVKKSKLRQKVADATRAHKVHVKTSKLALDRAKRDLEKLVEQQEKERHDLLQSALVLPGTDEMDKATRKYVLARESIRKRQMENISNLEASLKQNE